MLVTFTVNTDGWDRETKDRYRKAVSLVSKQLADSIRKDPKRFELKRSGNDGE